jgi:hypothetical protein
VLGQPKVGTFLVMQLESLLCTIQYFEDWSAQKRVSFPEDKTYDDRYFTIFDDSYGVIACTGFRRFWKWLNRNPYIYPVFFTELQSDVANPIVDWLINDLEQPLWILCGDRSVPDLFSYNGSNNATILSTCGKESGCLSKYFDSDFNKISSRCRRKSSSITLGGRYVTGRRNTLVIQVTPICNDRYANTIIFPPWKSASDGNSNLGVLLQGFLVDLLDSNLEVPRFLKMHHEA